MPLNGELSSAGGRLLVRTKTAPHYRLYALAGTTPPKPGLLRVKNGAGTAIELEVWALSEQPSAASSPRCRLRFRSARSSSPTAIPSKASWSRPRLLPARAIFQASAAGARLCTLRRGVDQAHMRGDHAPAVGKRTQVCIWRPILPGVAAR